MRANICFKSLDNNVWVVARRRIAAGEELLGDYSFPSQPRSAQDEAREVFSDDDGNDNECGKVGCTCDDTELVCCDSCPAAFHHSCLPKGADASGSIFMCRDCKIDHTGRSLPLRVEGCSVGGKTPQILKKAFWPSGRSPGIVGAGISSEQRFRVEDAAGGRARPANTTSQPAHRG